MSVVEIKNNFKEEALDYKGKVLVDFNATWCGPCRMLKPVIEELANNRDDIKVVAVDVDENEDASKEFNVYSIPCLVLLENGKEIKRSVGFKPMEELNKFLGDE